MQTLSLHFFNNKIINIPVNIANNIRNELNLIEAVDKPAKLETAPLPYERDALEPVMSKDTIEYHYDSLAKAYAKRYNAGEGDPEFNRGGSLLHNLFFTQLQPPKRNNRPTGSVLKLIHDKHGSFDELKDKWLETAMSIQGSGWVYLSKSGDIKTIKNQAVRKDVLLPLDMWEHSFALDYRADKKKYVQNFWRIVNWDAINIRLNDY
jgi:Fe-Mn family superoxide dismutase